MDYKIEITCGCGRFQQITLAESNTEYKCSKCKKHLFHLQIVKGYIYVLSNPAMQGLLKIGYTNKSVKERVAQLNNTGVPTSFEIEAIFESRNPYDDEQKIHNYFSKYRYSKNREFFQLDLDKVVGYINSILTCMQLYTKQSGYKLTHEVDQKNIDLLKTEFELSDEEFIEIQSNISDEDRQFYKGLSEIEILRKKLWEYKNW